MNAIVIVFMPARDAHLPTGEAASRCAAELSQQENVSDGTRAGLRQTSSRDQMTPPLWTWFIENPRSCGA